MIKGGCPLFAASWSFLLMTVILPMSLSCAADPQASVPASKLWLEAISPEIQRACAPALKDFQNAFQKITGKSLPAARSVEAPIPLRLEVSAPGPESFSGGARKGDYKITATPEAVTLSGESPLALTNALYGLLDSWGCRWAFPGDLGEIIPENLEASILIGTHETRIASDPRILSGSPASYSEGDVGDWVRRNRFGKQTLVTAHHSWASWIIPATLYNDPARGETYHPEYFSLIGGKRLVGVNPSKLQICTTNPEVIQLAIEQAKDYFRKHPVVDTFPCSPEDNFEFCQCEECLKLDTGALTAEGIPNVSDRVMAFANAIAAGIREEFPDKLVGVYAYNNYTLPPVRVKPAENVMVHITRMNYDLLRLIPREAGDSSSQFAELVEAWKRLVPHIYLYEYNPIYWAAGLPCPNYLEYAAAEKFYREKGALGFRSDPGEMPFRNKVNWLNDYLAMRVAVDAQADPETELRDVCRALFGSAGEAMTEYYQAMAGVTARNPIPEGFLGGGIRNFHRMFTPEIVAAGTAALAKAKKDAAGDPLLQKRLRMVELSHRYLGNYLEALGAAQEGDYEKSLKAFSRLERTLDTLAAGQLLENPAARLPMLRAGLLMALAEYAPRQAGFVQNWKILGPLDNSRRAAETTFASFEPVLDTTQNAHLPDGATLRWKDYHSPTGFLDFRKAQGKNPEGWSALTAYAATQFRAQKPTKVWLSFNSFNSFRVYLNGKEIFFRPGQQMDIPDQNGLSVTLNPGENTLIFRCTETASSISFPWGLYLRVLDPENPNRPASLDAP